MEEISEKMLKKAYFELIDLHTKEGLKKTKMAEWLDIIPAEISRPKKANLFRFVSTLAGKAGLGFTVDTKNNIITFSSDNIL
jgi:hypothetical protein